MLKKKQSKKGPQEEQTPETEQKLKKILFKPADYNQNVPYVLNAAGNPVQTRAAVVRPGTISMESASVRIDKDLKGAYVPENPEDYRLIELSINGFRVTACPGIDHKLVFPFSKAETEKLIADFIADEEKNVLDTSDDWDSEDTKAQIKSAMDGLKFALTAHTENRDNRNAEIEAAVEEFKAAKAELLANTGPTKALLIEQGLTVVSGEPVEETALKLVLLKKHLKK